MIYLWLLFRIFVIQIKYNVVIRFFLFVLLVLTAALVIKCAHPVAPSGGPKDVAPPIILETTPENGSASFTTNKFTLKFNEYISLDNIQQQALISPPMNEMPEFRIKGKSVDVKFIEDLKPNTTYSVYFGDAIVDITENNPLANYTYIFSTGDYVDSLSLSGYVYNALDLMPLEEVYVMLYKDNNDTIVFDSLPYYVVPYYLSKTNELGRFQFNGLSDDDYLLFAISDQNSNYIFDQPGEQIAFLDSLIHPIYLEKPTVDSINTDSITNIEVTTDSIIVKTDSTSSDSIHFDDTGSVELYMFLSPDTTQRLLKAEVVEKNLIRFSFAQPATDVKLESLKFSSDSTWLEEVFTNEKDTLYWYLLSPPTDSLILLLTQYDDTLGTVYLKLDTDKTSVRLKKKDKEDKKERLGWKSNISGSSLDLDSQIEIHFAQPYSKLNKIDSTLLVIGMDSIWDPEFKYTDSLKMRIMFPFDLLEETGYRIYFPDSSFTSWNNIHTEAIDIKFKTKTLSDYGILTFNLYPERKQHYILQILNSEEIVQREAFFSNDTSITFSYLNPAEYKYKIIYDNNKNKKWDPGDYIPKLQPEKVIYFSKEIKVRANWEIEEDWNW